jgi:hypothetical protein
MAEVVHNIRKWMSNQDLMAAAEDLKSPVAEKTVINTAAQMVFARKAAVTLFVNHCA